MEANNYSNINKPDVPPVRKPQGGKTETYIVLKPIAERFSRIANAMTDEDIKYIITSELREQLKKQDFTYMVGELYENWVEENEEMITEMFKKSLIEKFK